ncbi:MAG: hypothetical protein ACSHW9_03300 [Salinibacterium amurskyense]
MASSHQRRDQNDPDITSDDHNDLDFASGELPDDDPDVIEGVKELAELRALEERRRAAFTIGERGRTPKQGASPSGQTNATPHKSTRV